MKKFKKRSKINFSIKTNFQIKLILKIMFIVLLGTLVTSAVFYFYANKEVGASFKQFHVNAKNFLDFLLPAIFVSGFFGFVISFIIAIFFPHHFAGPLFRIENDLKNKMKLGDLTYRFNLRKGDELIELSQCLNDTFENIRVNVEIIDKSSKELFDFITKQERPDADKLKIVQENMAGALKKFKIY